MSPSELPVVPETLIGPEGPAPYGSYAGPIAQGFF